MRELEGSKFVNMVSYKVYIYMARIKNLCRGRKRY
jgi:hypothetical protein